MSAHDHDRQPDIEDAPYDRHQLLTEAVSSLLIEQGVFRADELRASLERIDAAEPAHGAKMVARAWVDAAFRATVGRRERGRRALGLDPSVIPIRVVENTHSVHNVIVCTLCSCYPRMLIGASPDWCKSKTYRVRCVREPRAVLAEFGANIPDFVEVRVYDSTAELRYMVLP